MKELGVGACTVLISRPGFLGGCYFKEIHQAVCECSFCCEVANNPSRGKTQFWAPALKYWLAGWWTYVQVCNDGPVIYTRYTLPMWARLPQWFSWRD